MTAIDTRVLIVGAGPIGLISGLLLHQHGVDFRIIERRPTLHQAPQAHVISNRTLEICRAVGIADGPIREAGPSLGDTRSVRWVDHLLGRDIGAFMLGKNPDEVVRMLTQSPTPTTNLSQDKFEQFLYDRLVAVAGEDVVLFEHAWTAFDEGDTYASAIETPAGTTTINSRYLIAADGAGSRVRKAIGVEMVGPDNIQSFANVHFSANLKEKLAGREGILYWVMDHEVDGVFIAHDISGNWIYMKSIDEDEAAGTLDPDKYKTLLAKALGEDVPFDFLSVNAWRMTAQIADAYQKDRVFLAGDAAHRFPPTGGIGMNTGFQDAHNLAWKIAMVERGASPAILDTYELERKDVAEANSSQSLTNAMKMFEVVALLDVDGDEKITMADIDAVIGDEERRASVQAAIDGQAAHFNMSGLDLGVCYEGSLVVADGTPPDSPDPISVYIPSTTPGTRLPHSAITRDGETCSTLDLVRHDQFTVWSYQPDSLAAMLSDLADELPVAGVSLAEENGINAVDEGLGSLFAEDEVLLVRPDGHIAARYKLEDAASRIGQDLRALLGWVGS